MNKRVRSESPQCVFALIKFHLQRSGFPTQHYCRDNQPHQYLKCIPIKPWLPARSPKWAEGEIIDDFFFLPPHCPDIPTDSSSNRKQQQIAAHSPRLQGDWQRFDAGCVCAVKHGWSNGRLNIYGLLDPPSQCGYGDGWHVCRIS